MFPLRSLLLTISCTCFFPLTVAACTLFGASGPAYVAGGGTLVCKVRDWKPQEQVLKRVQPAQGYAYYGLYSGKTKTFNAGGINEKGLFVAMSTSGSIPSKLRRRNYPPFRSSQGQRGNVYLLNHCATVEEALAQTQVFQEPVNYILADRWQVAYVEVLPGGGTVVRREQNGTICHTNHYVNRRSASYNIKSGLSSITRYNRIWQLLDTATKPLTPEDFRRFSEEQQDGPDNSIYRLGSKPNSTQTLAVLIAYIPPVGEPQLYIKYRAKPDQKGGEKHFPLQPLSKYNTI